jgi:hypothetical protein
VNLMKLPFLLVLAWASAAGAQTATPTPTATPVPTFPPETCYAVPASIASLVTIDAASGVETVIGPTGAGSTIRGLAIPAVGNTLYAATATTFGSISRTSGAFSPIGAFGTAVNGALGPIALDELVALTQNSGDGVLYAVHRTSHDPDTCWAVESAGDTLVTIDRSSGTDTAVGATSNGIEAVALVGSTLYAALGGQLGVLDRATGSFSTRSAAFGQGDPGPVLLDDIRGLAFDFDNRVLFASHRVAGGDDLLFLVDLTTGAHVPLQFGGGTADYVTIGGGSCVSPVDIEALAMDPGGSTLYGSDGDDLVTIDAATGACSVVGPFAGGPPISITGLGFSDDGTLYGSDVDQLYAIDTGSGAATPVGGGLAVGTGYRALDCPVAVPDVLFRIDPATGSYVPLHFDFDSADYALIEGGACGTEVEALAFDEYNDVLLGIDGSNDRLMDIDAEDGFCVHATPNPLGFGDILSMAYASATNEVYAAGTSSRYVIDRIGGAAVVVSPLTAGTGYEALTCPAQLCKPVLRLSHHKTAYAGRTLEYRLFWLNPCEGVTPTSVVITDAIPAGLTVLSAQSAHATIQVQNGVVTLSDATLPKGPAAEARILVRVDAAAGTLLVNEATLRDGSGRVVARDRLSVRPDKNTGKTLEMSGHKKTRTGARATVTAQYQRIGAGGTLVMTLPGGVTLEETYPLPASQAANVLTWTNLPAPAGKVQVRLFVDPALPAPNVLAVAATLDDAGDDPVDHSWEIRVLESAGSTGGSAFAAMKLSAPRQAKAGLSTRIAASYRKITGTAAVTLTLPAGLLIESVLPAGAEIAGSTVNWPALPGPHGKVKVRATVATDLAPGALLPVSASLLSSGGDSAGASTTIVVR